MAPPPSRGCYVCGQPVPDSILSNARDGRVYCSPACVQRVGRRGEPFPAIPTARPNLGIPPAPTPPPKAGSGPRDSQPDDIAVVFEERPETIPPGPLSPLAESAATAPDRTLSTAVALTGLQIKAGAPQTAPTVLAMRAPRPIAGKPYETMPDTREHLKSPAHRPPEEPTQIAASTGRYEIVRGANEQRALALVDRTTGVILATSNENVAGALAELVYLANRAGEPS